MTTRKKGTPEGLKRAPRRSAVFPVVGMGASAGGLEALEQFFAHMPADSGMAFVIVQHLDPERKSILAEIVQRYTPMPVAQVEDGMRVEPNRVFVIPPNRDMAILHGVLHLIEPAAPRARRTPIDFFFRSLAQDIRERAIGIVLSGTGTEGTLGLKAIKGENGVVLVQDPKSAKYDGMPRSAVATGLADVILPPNEMPEKLLAYVRRAPGLEPKGRADAPRVAVQLQKIFILLRAHTGHDLSLYKHSTILRRIAKRMAFHQFERMDDYVRRLQEDAQEVALLFKDCLIAVTGFFRDPEAFQTLQAKIIPELVAGEPADHPIRVWVPGCSTGEEAYTLAILLKEYLEEHKLANPVQIFATDIDHDAIEAARLGAYPGGIVADVSPERLQRFFVQEDNRYRVKKAVRDMLVFADQNLVRDPPFTKLDLISCRNLLIYMETELQKQVFPLFHYALNRGGISSSALRRASASSATSSPSSTANGSSSGSGEM